MTPVKSDQTRQKIFETSLRLFVQKGYSATSVRDIAAKAGISTGLLFHYFPSKQALLEAHIKFAATGIDAAIDLLKSEKSPLHIFSSIAEMTTEGMSAPMPRLLYSLVNQPLPGDTVKAYIRGEEIITLSTAAVMKGQQLGEIRQGNPVSLAMVFWGAIQGTAQMMAGLDDISAPEAAWIIAVLESPR
jgi:TetR/AcrR family transcriptional regulator